MKNKKRNNAGFTLVELLVAMAVGAIIISAVVVLVATGTGSFRKNTNMSKAQEEANMALNQICDSIMECSSIDLSVYNAKDDIENEKNINNTTDSNNTTPEQNDAYGEKYGDTGSLLLNASKSNKSENDYAKSIDYKYMAYKEGKKDDMEGKLWVETGDEGSKNILCENVTSFKVQIIDGSVKVGTSVTGNGLRGIDDISNPVQMKVTIEVTVGKESRSVSRTIGVRNELTLDEVKIGGESIGKKTFNELSKGDYGLIVAY